MQGQLTSQISGMTVGSRSNGLGWPDQKRAVEQKEVAVAHRSSTRGWPGLARGHAGTLRWVEDDQKESIVLLEPPTHAGKHQSMECVDRPWRTGGSMMSSRKRASLIEIREGISFKNHRGSCRRRKRGSRWSASCSRLGVICGGARS
jgi:hypothetical protein